MALALALVGWDSGGEAQLLVVGVDVWRTPNPLFTPIRCFWHFRGHTSHYLYRHKGFQQRNCPLVNCVSAKKQKSAAFAAIVNSVSTSLVRPTAPSCCVQPAVTARLRPLLSAILSVQRSSRKPKTRKASAMTATMVYERYTATPARSLKPLGLSG